MSNINKGRKKVIFRLAAPGATEVKIAGSFNGWDPQKHLLKKKPGGFWEKTMMLSPGIYEYKFQVDGRWREDPANSRTCINPFGTPNSIIEVIGG